MELDQFTFYHWLFPVLFEVWASDSRNQNQQIINKAASREASQLLAPLSKSVLFLFIIRPLWSSSTTSSCWSWSPSPRSGTSWTRSTARPGSWSQRDPAGRTPWGGSPSVLNIVCQCVCDSVWGGFRRQTLVDAKHQPLTGNVLSVLAPCVQETTCPSKWRWTLDTRRCCRSAACWEPSTVGSTCGDTDTLGPAVCRRA